MADHNQSGTYSALHTDLYELTMLQAYHTSGLDKESVFSLFVRKLPASRNYLLACGLEDVLDYLEGLRFTSREIDYLHSLDLFGDEFLEWLRSFSFSGDVFAMPEGTPFFANEPLLEVIAPIGQAQLLETFILNQIHFQTLAASKASRVVTAAGDRAVVDFGFRRMHGLDAGTKGARAFSIAGVGATSNVYAGLRYGLPVTGTMAHSYIQAHVDEMEAFRSFSAVYPETILLIDTYDILEGVRKVIRLAQELGPDFKVRGLRIDSNHLTETAAQVRKMLDSAGLYQVKIFASGGLDEYAIEELARNKAPIDGFGVGTNMGVSKDAPYLDIVYKLTEYDGEGRLKSSPGKTTLPGKKQVFRKEENGRYVEDTICGRNETFPGRPLLSKVMENGKRLQESREDLESIKQRCSLELSKLPENLLRLEPAQDSYPVRISESLQSEQQRLIQHYQA